MDNETQPLVAARPIKPFQVVAVDGGTHAYPLAAGYAGGSIGLAQNAAQIAAGTLVDVVTAGPAVACAGAPIAAGDFLCADGAGQVQPVPPGYAGLAIGRALDAAEAAGALLLVRVQPIQVAAVPDDAEPAHSA